MVIVPGTISTKQFHQYLLGSVAPRPICFASTVDKDGRPNLSPFSFFNAFGSKPPILIFSPARRVRNNTIKHTLENIRETMEVVINVVNYNMVQQTSLASCEYPKEINEFEKSGFTPIASELVRPFRVKESPVSLECKVLNIIETGQEGGAANLIICEVVCMHLNDDVLDDNGQIDPHKIDLVARMGLDYYCRASGDAVFEVPKPNLELGMGFDQLPAFIKNSRILTGNDLGMLANCTEMPAADNRIKENKVLRQILSENPMDETREDAIQHYAQKLLQEGKITEAWQVLLSGK
ncbi:MAG TPA: flavin reductase family protein [Edaphocola sp.]|nr:flavin reductase family protein [Edaphocola sp.]